jgi:sugar/nucleoside kinase (ribokinase family)
VSHASFVVLGDAVLDVLVAPSIPMRPGGDVPASIRVAPGGQGANVAVRLARRNVDVRLACALGDDPAGTLVRDALESDGVTVDAGPAARTGSVVVLVDANGERTMLSQRAPLVPALTSVGTAATWVVVSGYLVGERGATDLFARLPAAPRRALLGSAVPDGDAAAWRAAAVALTPDLVVANRDEEHLAPPASVVVITDPTGARATVGGREVRVSRMPVADAADTTGAGDAFAAALLARLADTEWPPSGALVRDALDGATAAAAEVVRVAGAQGRTPSERGSTLSP